jgi:ankyrin repeat protein
MACYQGDVETVRVMLRSGEGRPTDLTASGWTPMGVSQRILPVCAALTYLQSAVASGKINVIAEFLDCGVDVDAVTHHANLYTALILSSYLKHPDTVRFLLQRGASADHMGSNGLGADKVCWLKGDDLTSHSSTDVFNLLAESSHFEINEVSRNYTPTLCIVAMTESGVQIDALVSLGADIHLRGASGAAAIHIAAFFGNYSTYSALASYYDGNIFKNDKEFGSLLLFCAIRGRKDDVDKKLYLHSGGRCLKHDEVLIDTLQRGVGPRTAIQVASSVPGGRLPGIHDQEIEADKLAAALGPETEAWYLSVLRRCGLLVHGDYQRLRELAEAGYVAAGFVYVDEEEPKERDYRVRGDREEDGDVLGLGQEDIYTDIDEVSRRNSISEADDANQFWDAEEVL